MSTVEALWQLQEIDFALVRHAQKLSNMPQVEAMKELVSQKKKLSSQLNRFIGERKDLEMEIEELTSIKSTYEEEVEATKAKAQERADNFRAVNDLEAKLTSLAKRIEKVDFELKEKNSRLSKLVSLESQGITLASQLDAKGKSLKDDYEHMSLQIRNEVASLETKRQETLAILDNDVIESYERSSKRFKGLAVEVLKGNTPSICRVKLQADAYQSLIKGPAISECPYCHRILITKELSD